MKGRNISLPLFFTTSFEPERSRKKSTLNLICSVTLSFLWPTCTCSFKKWFLRLCALTRIRPLYFSLCTHTHVKSVVACQVVLNRDICGSVLMQSSVIRLRPRTVAWVHRSVSGKCKVRVECRQVMQYYRLWANLLLSWRISRGEKEKGINQIGLMDPLSVSALAWAHPLQSLSLSECSITLSKVPGLTLNRVCWF